MNRMPVRLICAVTCAAVLLLAAAARPADAQYRPMTVAGSAAGDVKGEKYHVELSGNIWNPAPDFLFKSEGLGIPGSEIDLDEDLGIEQKKMYELRVVLRPTKKTKFRFHYLPMTYQGDAILKKDLVFNGILFPIAIDVKTDFSWKAYRFDYEWDIFYTARGYVGVILEVKYADTELSLDSAVVGTEFVKARAPIPAAGLAGRFYPLSFVSVSGEFTYFRLPDSVDENASFSALDFDIYGTVNVTHNFGVQAGYRSIDMGFRIDQDEGSIKLKGPYIGGVVRF